MSLRVEICLATYNGSHFLAEFYESLRHQTFKDWTLIARDDQSSDCTRLLLDQFAQRDQVVTVLDDAAGNVGVIQNFSILLARSTADYVMLADQDDVWFPEKVSKSLGAIRELERGPSGRILPALVFTDLDIVDVDLKSSGRTFLEMQGLSKLAQPSFRQLLTQNVAPGCTMIVNRALLERALPVPHDVAMHDWWLIQVASLFGRIGFIAEPTIAYRQHDGNVVGAKSSALGAKAIDVFKGAKQYRRRLRSAQLQAISILARYSDSMAAGDREAVATFAGLSNFPPMLRQLAAARAGLRKAGLLRTLGFYCLM